MHSPGLGEGTADAPDSTAHGEAGRTAVAAGRIPDRRTHVAGVVDRHTAAMVDHHTAAVGRSPIRRRRSSCR